MPPLKAAVRLASLPPALGDPFNNAEILAIRVVSLGVAVIATCDCLSDIDISKEWVLDDDNKWIVDLLCAGVFAALVYSQLRLFQGIWAATTSVTTTKKAKRSRRRKSP